MMVTERNIYEYLDSFGMSHANLGFQFLITGIDMLIKNEASRNGIVDLYKLVAEKHNTEPTRVERAIRVSIKKSSSPEKTTREFLARAADELLLAAKESQ